MNKAHNRPKKYNQALVFNRSTQSHWIDFDRPLTATQAFLELFKIKTK